MSDISLDYSGDSSPSASSSRSSSRSSVNGKDRPLWVKKRDKSSSSRSRSSSKSPPPKRKRSPIRAPSVTPPRRRRESPRRRSRSPRSPRRNRSPPRRPRSPRSPLRQRRNRSPSNSPIRQRRSPPNRPRSRSRSPQRRNYRRQRSRSSSPADRRNFAEKERDQFWNKRRERRSNIQYKGEREVWGQSPSQKDIQETYRLRVEDEEMQAQNEKKGAALKADREKAKRKEERIRKNLSDEESSTESSDSEVENRKKEKKNKKKSKKNKKEKKPKKVKKEKKVKKSKKEKKAEIEVSKSADSSDEWEERAPDAAEVSREGSYSPGPAIPEHIKAREDIQDRLTSSVTSYGKDLLKGEGAGMAAYAARGERIPRRGEIGLSSSEITQYEKWGYVMSGSRHKAMEATRLRKENQILTAEEKRLLNGVSMEAKKKKEDAVLDQFRSLIKNKNVRS